MSKRISFSVFQDEPESMLCIQKEKGLSVGGLFLCRPVPRVSVCSLGYLYL